MDRSHRLTRAVGSCLCLAATPTFAAMAVWTAIPNGHHMSMGYDGMTAFSGMTVMYALMGVFHATPWLNLLATRGSSASTAEAQQLDDGRVVSQGK